MAEVPPEIVDSLARFGLTSFRPGQLEVIESILAGENCVCIMPTGGGKSLCFQLPAVLRPGLTLVVSPLIALMKDQVDALQRQGVQAACINSSLSPPEQQQCLDQMRAGELDLVYVAPERLRSRRFIDAVKQSNLQLLAVDEAHCISEWGHDFRPDYARLGRYRRQLGQPQTIALTATATPTVRDDVAAQLGLASPRKFLAGFARPNLHYQVQIVGGAGDKADVLLDFLKQTPGSGIIYVSARKRCDEVAEIVAQTGRRVGVYHAGLLPEDRRRAQEDFMEGRQEIVVATVAFGMGIDKADVRFVVHYNMPGTIEGYYQEAGRAGRDGQPSRCLLVYSYSDRRIQEFFIESAYPPREVVAQVYDFLRGLDDDPIQLTQYEIKDELRLSIGPEGVGSCLQLLDKAGAVERLEPLQNLAIVRLNSDLPAVVDLLPTNATKQRKVLATMEQLVGPRRWEDVYFQPRAVAARAEMELSAVNRALRELRRLEAFDYVPPFRGRAVRVLTPDTPFDRLEIDFETYEQRKAAEYDKLDQMVRYANSRGCRQTEILRYFGDESGGRCGHCDNCDPPAGAPPAAPVDADAAQAQLLKAVRIALAGVARAGGRFGKQMIAQMLAGSKSSKLTKFRLDRLSTFGLLSHLRQTDVSALLDALLSVGLLEQVDVERNRPVLQLTGVGQDVMHERSDLPADLPLSGPVFEALRRPPGRSAAAATTDSSPAVDSGSGGDVDLQLLDKLRAWRSGRAEAERVQHYRILPNAALSEIASVRPGDLDELAAVRGMGEVKLSRYGAELLEIVAGTAAPPPDAALESQLADATHVAEPAARPEEPPAMVDVEPEEEQPPDDLFEAAGREDDPPAPPREPEPRPAYYWTWRLLNAEFTPQEIAEIRDLSAEEVLQHAVAAAEHGLRVRPEQLLSPDHIAELEPSLHSGDVPQSDDNALRLLQLCRRAVAALE